jgi:hypothetical protein
LEFNLDEVGTSAWEDRRQKTVIAPAVVPEHDVFQRVSRRVRHMTLLACVGAPGDSLTPMVTTLNPIANDIWSHGLRQNEDVMLPVRQPVYIDEALFSEYVSRAFLPYVKVVPPMYRRKSRNALNSESRSRHASTRCGPYYPRSIATPMASQGGIPEDSVRSTIM